VEEREEAASEQVPHVAERPVERLIGDLVEREETALEDHGPGVHVEERARVATVARPRLVEHRHALVEPGGHEPVRQEHLAEHGGDDGRDPAPDVDLHDMDVLVRSEGEEPVSEVVQLRQRVGRGGHEADGVVREGSGGAVGLVGVVGEDHLGLPGRQRGKGGSEQDPRTLQRACGALGQRFLPLVVVDPEVRGLERPPAEGRVVLRRRHPGREGEEQQEE
jgi:hypothetical protein